MPFHWSRSALLRSKTRRPSHSRPTMRGRLLLLAGAAAPASTVRTNCAAWEDAPSSCLRTGTLERDWRQVSIRAAANSLSQSARSRSARTELLARRNQVRSFASTDAGLTLHRSRSDSHAGTLSAPGSTVPHPAASRASRDTCTAPDVFASPPSTLPPDWNDLRTSLQAVEVVGPPLHHLSTLGETRGTVVRTAHFVALGMR